MGAYGQVFRTSIKLTENASDGILQTIVLLNMGSKVNRNCSNEHNIFRKQFYLQKRSSLAFPPLIQPFTKCAAVSHVLLQEDRLIHAAFTQTPLRHLSGLDGMNSDSRFTLSTHSQVTFCCRKYAPCLELHCLCTKNCCCEGVSVYSI